MKEQNEGQDGRELKPIPIDAAKRVADQYGYDQVIVFGRRVGDAPNPHGEHLTTYGVNKIHCDVAAQVGNFLKTKIMGWHEAATAGLRAHAAEPEAATGLEECRTALQWILNIARDPSGIDDPLDNVGGIAEQALDSLAARPQAVDERVAQLTAHRAVGNQEQDLDQGKLAGYCLVCQVLWPCETAKPQAVDMRDELLEILAEFNGGFIDIGRFVGKIEDLAAQSQVDCGNDCHYQEPYGFVPMAGCPIHDKPEVQIESKRKEKNNAK